MQTSKSLTALIAVSLLVLGAAACGESTTTAAPATTATAGPPSPTAAPSWKHGVYQVGVQIQPGTYKTDGVTTVDCYWNRLKNDSGDSSAIIAREFTSGPATMTVEPTDAFIRFGGGCVWTRA